MKSIPGACSSLAFLAVSSLPGDGITQFHAVLGPYDVAAVAWGYGLFGKSAEEEKTELARRAKAFAPDRGLFRAAGELPSGIEDSAHDPRVMKENTGAERIAATRLGVANILRSLTRLDKATGGNEDLFAGTSAVMPGTRKGLLDSVSTPVSGTKPRLGASEGRKFDLAPPDEQGAAVFYLPGDGARSLESDTVYPAWLRPCLPQPKARLDLAARQAAGEDDRLHHGQMARDVSLLMTQTQ